MNIAFLHWQIYRQFSITLVVSAMGLSLIVALILTPALCALILKPNPQPAKWAIWFNRKARSAERSLSSNFKNSACAKAIFMVIFIALITIFALFYRALPTSFIPSEDQGICPYNLNCKMARPCLKSREVGESIRQYFLAHEKDNVDLVMIRYGRNFSGTGQKFRPRFIALKHWDTCRSSQYGTSDS